MRSVHCKILMDFILNSLSGHYNMYVSMGCLPITTLYFTDSTSFLFRLVQVCLHQSTDNPNSECSCSFCVDFSQFDGD